MRPRAEISARALIVSALLVLPIWTAIVYLIVS